MDLGTVIATVQTLCSANQSPKLQDTVNTTKAVPRDDIIGRRDDVDSIVGKLLDSDVQSDVSFLSIVGIGGLGKTAVAQLVYDHPRVKDAFPLRMWTCVSDQHQGELDVKNILAKILEQLQSQLQAQVAAVAGKKYLLVLDDVCTEKPDQWRRLADSLMGGDRGSWIVVTTRSHMTAEITGGQLYVLSGLSKENSWRLFARTAFGSGSDQPNPPPDDELVLIGQDIVDGCRGVPRAITEKGSFLYGQDKSKWLYLQTMVLANITDDDDSTMTILKLSFYHLETPLKNCFRFCTLFPKDYEMQKDTLIRLWIAQGYIVPRHDHQSIEDAGEEYFSILVRRCFFQDIKVDEFGEIESCKIHDLVHDITQNEAMTLHDLMRDIAQIEASKVVTCTLDRHKHEKYNSLGKTLFNHHEADYPLAVKKLVAKFRWLTVLDLSDSNIKCLPDSIVKLRYINLSNNKELEALLNSITEIRGLLCLLLELWV